MAVSEAGAGKAHFIGIAGIGMAATALLLREQGWSVTGSDEGFYPPASEILPRAGINVSSPHAAANVPADVDAIVIGKHAKLTQENPEVAAAFASGKPILSFPDVLAQVTRNRDRIVVAGSYGKSTTASLLAWVLVHAGKHPGYFLGAVPKNIPSNAALGGDAPFILEGDEYPSSNTDPRAKFLHYAPQSLLLTSAVHDHVNVFPTHADYLAPFQQLVAELPSSGLLVACADEPHAITLAGAAPCRVVTYGLSDANAAYRAENIGYGEESTFDLIGPDLRQPMTTTQLGAHNIQNMIGAAALLLEKALATPREIAAAFASYHGIIRRLDKLTTRSSIPVYEGFGSSREKSRAAIDAIRLHFPDKRLVIVFEPYTFSWRSRDTLFWYDTVFDGAGEVFVYQPPSHGAASHNQVSQDDIAERIEAAGMRVAKLGRDDKADLASITGKLRPGDVVLVLTTGNLGGLIPRIIEKLESIA
ncbi:MAG: UDP-N-acetylmuramate: L-alanyl-gamma-D-glutamyl-meso-diaminopimelate ligase [Methylobacteriaceae bacterium]|nr:UDP-N-acetylmuramate: L-alanyl-gamma-D-glutamyl-meso-diaminopimelate ligase [Methylobacteriaceae bacterium]